MPTYEYQCNECEHRFEEFQSITAPPLSTCPECNGKVRRLISSGNGLIFKGSGFYITDYKKSSSGDSDKKSDTGKTEDKSKTKAETSEKSKPAASESKTNKD